MYLNYKKSIWIKLLYGILLFSLITWTFSTTLYIDESFTLGLIKHSWSEIINLDALDVHPPLYYLVLKAFLNITTFWTSSMVIKAIFARIFSIICFAIMGKGIQIIFKKALNKDINFNIIFLGLLLLPNILYHATCIRMYAFGAMLITWELICLVNYRQNNKTLYLIYALILAEMAAYTHYFAAIIAGLLLIYEFLSSIKYKQFNSTIKLGISGIALLIFFIPWGTIAFKQVSSVSHNYWMPNSLDNFVDLFYYRRFSHPSFFYVGFLILLLTTLICYLTGSDTFKAIYRRILFGFYGTMLLGITVSYLVRPVFQSRYLFFIFPLYLALTINKLISLLNKKINFVKLLAIFTMLFLSIGVIRNAVYGVRYIKNDFIIYKNLKKFNHQSNKKLISPLNENYFLIPQYSLYLPNKDFIIYHNKKLLLITIQTGNAQNDKKLFSQIYPNVIFEKK